MLLDAEAKGRDAVKQTEGLDDKLVVLEKEVRVTGDVQGDRQARLLLWVGRTALRSHLQTEPSLFRTLVSSRLQLMNCIWEEQLRSSEAKSHPEKLPEAPGPVDINTFGALLGIRVGVEAHGAEETRQTKQVISMEMGDENLSDATYEDNMT